MSQPKAHLHFGSLEHAERERLAKLEEQTKRQLDKLKGAGIGGPAVGKAAEPLPETQELSSSSQAAIQRQQELKETIAKRKRARELAVPTNDNQVKLKLREYGEPICLYAEGPPERRERLREVMAQNLDLDAPEVELRGAETLKDPNTGVHPLLQHPKRVATADDENKQKEVFYTEGPAELKAARVWISNYSLQNATDRLARERAEAEKRCHEPTAEVAAYTSLENHLSGVQNQLSNFGDDRPVSFIAFSPGSDMCATGSWSAVVKLWHIPSCQLIHTLRGHTERVSGLAWHPQTNSTQSRSAANILSGGCDGVAKLWSLESTKAVGELKGHAGRLSRVAFHPSGRFAGTASFDTSWRLWDVETCKELLLQEGHTRALYAIAFHPDGALVATAGLDAITRVWDLRSGKSIQVLQGHVKQILALDFSPDGVTLASGSDDHTIRLWDLRKRACAYTIPAHSSLISHVRFQPHHGRFLLSTSYDNMVKLWSMRDYSLLKTMEGHEGRVMCGDISDNGQYFATAAMDHTWKLWGRS